MSSAVSIATNDKSSPEHKLHTVNSPHSIVNWRLLPSVSSVHHHPTMSPILSYSSHCSTIWPYQHDNHRCELRVSIPKVHYQFLISWSLTQCTWFNTHSVHSYRPYVIYSLTRSSSHTLIKGREHPAQISRKSHNPFQFTFISASYDRG